MQQKPRPRILAIDDTPANLQVLAAALASDFAVQIATSGAMGLALAARSAPDLILLDVMMPEMDGHEVCRRLQADPALRHIPVIFVSAMAGLEAEAAGYALGACDYITKPIRVDRAKLRIRNLLEREALRAALGGKERELERVAHYDNLTGLPNRILLADRMEQALIQAQRRGERLAVVFLDLDGFKAINDQHGHAAGDHLLITLAQRMQQTLRDSDTLARLGGDEFVAVLQDVNDVSASAPMLKRLLDAASIALRHAGGGTRGGRASAARQRPDHRAVGVLGLVAGFGEWVPAHPSPSYTRRPRMNHAVAGRCPIGTKIGS